MPPSTNPIAQQLDFKAIMAFQSTYPSQPQPRCLMLVNCKQAFLREPYLPINLLFFFLRHFVKYLIIALFTLSSSYIHPPPSNLL